MKDPRISSVTVAKYIKALNDQEGREVEKILVRYVSPLEYAVQVWERGYREPEAFYLSLTGGPDERDQPSARSGSSRGGS